MSDYADSIAARIDNADQYTTETDEYVLSRVDFLEALAAAAREGYALGYAAGIDPEIDSEHDVSAWYVIEGDDHEQRIIDADTEEEALQAVSAGFSDQYSADYGTDLLVTLGKFGTLEEAQAAYPNAEEE